MSYLSAYDTKDQEINTTISFNNKTICENFRIMDNKEFYIEQDCTVNVSLHVQFITINKEIEDNIVQIYAKCNNEYIQSSSSTIRQDGPLSLTFITKLNKDDCITFHTASDNNNLKVGAKSFNGCLDLPQSDCPVSSSLSIYSI